MAHVTHVQNVMVIFTKVTLHCSAIYVATDYVTSAFTPVNQLMILSIKVKQLMESGGSVLSLSH